MKSLLNYIPTHIFVLYGAGVLFQFYTDCDIPLAFLFGALVMCLIGLWFDFFYKYLFCLLVFSVGIISIELREYDLLEGQTKKEFFVFVIDTELKENDYSKSYYAIVENSNNSIIEEKVLLRIEKDSLLIALGIGDKILAKSSFKRIPPKRNPYDFDYKKYLSQQNVYRQVYLGKGSWKKLGESQFSLKRIAFEFRKELIVALEKRIKNKDVLSVTIALLLGERQFISSELQQDYANAGVIHILAVSGLHIGIIVLLLHFLLKPLRRIKYGELIVFVFMLVFLWTYAFLAGLSASVIRAVTMFSFVSFGLAIKHRSIIYHSIMTSALILVLINPFYFFDLGFKMSYIAVFSIVTLYPILSKLWQPKNRILKYLWDLSAVSFSAQIGLLPLSLYYFHQFPGLFMLSNLIVLPSLSVVLVLGFVTLLLSYGNIDFEVFYQSYSFLVDLLNKFISFISQQENWLFDTVYFSGLMLFVFYISLFLFVFLLKKTNLRNIYIWGTSLLLLQLVFFYEVYNRQHKKELIVYHQYKKTVISISSDSKVNFYGAVRSKKDRLVKSYIEKTGIVLNKIHTEIPSVFKFKNQYLFIIDSLGVYNIPNFQLEIVLLKSSPKINLERCLQQLKPKIIIADGSSYPYLKEKWKTTCKKMKIEFYDTSQKGAFQFN